MQSYRQKNEINRHYFLQKCSKKLGKVLETCALQKIQIVRQFSELNQFTAVSLEAFLLLGLSRTSGMKTLTLLFPWRGEKMHQKLNTWPVEFKK